MTYQYPSNVVVQPTKSFVVTWLLSWLLGYFGIDRFYLGKVGTGILKLVTLGGFGVCSWNQRNGLRRNRKLVQRDKRQALE